MRLIDADAVPQEFWEYEFDGKWRGCTIKDLLDSQPTVKPEPHWIPVTERLPEVDMYRTLTTIRTPHKGANVRSGHFYKGFFFNDNGDTWNATDKEVLAWMPLPEPYKGVTE